MELQQAIEKVEKDLNEVLEKVNLVTDRIIRGGEMPRGVELTKHNLSVGESTALERVLHMLKEIELPEKEPPEVLPKVVADILTRCKRERDGLADSLNLKIGDPIFTDYQESVEYLSWKCTHENQEKLAKAWLNGFEVEAEKRWIVYDEELFLAKPIEESEENIFSITFREDNAYLFESEEEARKNSTLFSLLARVKEVVLDER